MIVGLGGIGVSVCFCVELSRKPFFIVSNKALYCSCTNHCCRLDIVLYCDFVNEFFMYFIYIYNHVFCCIEAFIQPTHHYKI